MLPGSARWELFGSGDTDKLIIVVMINVRRWRNVNRRTRSHYDDDNAACPQGDPLPDTSAALCQVIREDLCT